MSLGRAAVSSPSAETQAAQSASKHLDPQVRSAGKRGRNVDGFHTLVFRDLRPLHL